MVWCILYIRDIWQALIVDMLEPLTISHPVVNQLEWLGYHLKAISNVFCIVLPAFYSIDHMWRYWGNTEQCREVSHSLYLCQILPKLDVLYTIWKLIFIPDTFYLYILPSLSFWEDIEPTFKYTPKKHHVPAQPVLHKNIQTRYHLIGIFSLYTVVHFYFGNIVHVY